MMTSQISPAPQGAPSPVRRQTLNHQDTQGPVRAKEVVAELSPGAQIGRARQGVSGCLVFSQVSVCCLRLVLSPSSAGMPTPHRDHFLGQRELQGQLSLCDFRVWVPWGQIIPHVTLAMSVVLLWGHPVRYQIPLYPCPCPQEEQSPEPLQHHAAATAQGPGPG